jgi:hypothetical protein
MPSDTGATHFLGLTMLIALTRRGAKIFDQAHFWSDKKISHGKARSRAL